MKVVATAVPLKAFAEPSSTARVEAKLPVGRYVVAGDAVVSGNDTWMPIASAQIADGSSWLCVRSGYVVYARVVDAAYAPAPRVDYGNDAAAVDEKELVKTLATFAGWGYDRQGPRYPGNIGTVKLPHAPPNVNNCCTFVEALVAGTFTRVHDVAWTDVEHAQLMIDSDDDPFSPVTALVHSGIAVPGPDDDLAPPAPWTVVQGWKSRWQNGHTFVVVDHHWETDKVLVLESNCTSELNGVGWRGLGRLGAVDLDHWWQKPGVWTWARVTSSFPLRHRCELRVKSRTLAQP
jgi:hypothetical protein